MTETEDYFGFIQYIRKLLITALGKSEEEIYFERVPVTDDYQEDELFVCGEDEGGTAITGIRLQPLYLRYREGTEIGELLGDVMASLQSPQPYMDKSVFQKIGEYETIKERLIIRAISYERNKTLLQDYVFRTVGDIAITVYIVINENEESFLSFKLDRRIIAIWGVSEEEVLKRAVYNTASKYPPRIYSFSELLGGALKPDSGIFMEPSPPVFLDETESGNCLTNTIRLNGAVSLFLPGVANRIAGLFQDDFYAVFTSIHEVMVHKASRSNPEHLKEALKGMETCIKEDGTEFLSSHIYYYSNEKKKFRIIEPIKFPF